MKKRLAGLLLAAAMCLAFVPAAVMPVRAEGGAIEAVYDAETRVLTVTLPEAPTAPVLLLAAGYDDGGRMTDAAVRRLEAGAAGEQTFDGIAESYVYKAFLLSAAEESGGGTGGGGVAVYGAPVTPSAASGKNYKALLAAQGQVYVPTLDDAAARAVAQAVDAYVEANTEKEKTEALFAETSEAYTTEDNETGKLTALAKLMRDGTDAEKRKALAEVQRARAAMDLAVRAAAVLDAAADEELVAAQAELEDCAARAALVLASSDDKHAEALKWAQELTDRWDATQQKGRLKNFAEQLGVDARTAYQALTDAQAILKGEYEAEAKFYDTCTRVAMGVKTASKVGVYVCATIATGGAASAAGGLTIAEAAGIAVGGVDCVVEMERTGMKIILGDDHKVVMAVEEKLKTYDALMFLAGVATFDPTKASTGEKLLFLEDLVEKNIDAYENVKVCMDEMTGLVIDRIEDQTKQIAVDYTRIEAKDKADLSQAARELLDASDTGIIGVDPKLNDGSEKEQKQSFTKSVDSSDAELSRTYAKAGASAPMEETISAFEEKLDVEVRKVYTRQTGSGGEGGGGGGGGGSSGGGGGGSGDGIDLPEPDYSYDSVQSDGPDMSLPPEIQKEATYSYYKEGKKVGEVQYVLDEGMRYWPVREEWYCGDGDWLITEYYKKGDTREFEWHETGYGDIGHKVVTAERYGMIANRYARHEYREGNSFTSRTDWYDYARYYPNGQLYELEKRDGGNELAFYQYSPDGALYEYETDWNTDAGYFNSSYTYYVYPAVDPKIPFDPTGHLAESTVHSANEFQTVSYLLASSLNCNSEGDPVSTTWGYTVVTGNSTDAGWDHTGWIPITTVPYVGD